MRFSVVTSEDGEEEALVTECAMNEVWKPCGPCEGTCTDLSVDEGCDDQCPPKGICECQSNHVREPLSRSCVLKKACDKKPIQTLPYHKKTEPPNKPNVYKVKKNSFRNSPAKGYS